MLAGSLAYTGLRHAALVLDLRGPELAVAILAASGRVLAGNLAVTTVLVMGAAWLPHLAKVPGAGSTPRGSTAGPRRM